MKDGALWNNDVYRPNHSVIVGNVGVNHLQKSQNGSRRAGSVSSVHKSRRLCVGLRIIEGYLVVLNRYLYADGDTEPGFLPS